MSLAGSIRQSLLLALSAVSFASSAGQPTQPSVTNYQTEGNLESLHPVGCVPAEELKNIYTPADLYKGYAACVVQGNIKNGPLIFALAGVYGRFDTLRVTDKSSHQAILVLQMQELGPLPEDQLVKIREELVSITTNEEKLGALCNQIRKIGPPNYVPRYMIQHGMHAFLRAEGDDDGLVSDFDAEAAWEKSLSTYVHCPPPNNQP